jgi:prepilin signal peptidase PulO-like enzyme (type II secretory pathway)
MGGGDFKLLAGLAAWVGIGYLPVILAIAAISGLIITFIQIALNNSKLSSRVPFGPYLSFAGIITITNLESLACFSMFMP